VVATLGDQDAGQRGLFVDFFGRPASTHKAVALLALEHRVPMLVIGVRKVAEPMRYQIVVEDHILPEEYDDRPDAIKVLTQRFTAALERVVRAAPEQYFWLHRRWKHQPVAKKAKRARRAA
jgi:KDO2-lipid IV(A) lauroyltransferase